MNFRRGVIAGLGWGVVGLVGPPVGIAVFTLIRWSIGDAPCDIECEIAWWQMRAFPGIVVIPMFLFFAGLVTYAPSRYVGFAKNLVTLVVTSLPLAVILGMFGMVHLRCKSVEHPAMYCSEVLMFLIPLGFMSLLLMISRADPSHGDLSSDNEPSKDATLQGETANASETHRNEEPPTAS